MELEWNESEEGNILLWSRGEYSEWRLIENPPVSRNGNRTVYILIRIMVNQKGGREGVQVGEFFEKNAAFLVAQLIEDGEIVKDRHSTFLR